MPKMRNRHPLFLRLLRSSEATYAAAVTPVAWDDDHSLASAEGVVYLVTTPCSRARSWARQLRKLHRVDKSHETEDRISFISAAPINPSNLKQVGRTKCEIYDDDFNTIRSTRAARHVQLQTTFLAVIVERVDGDAVGFVSFAMRWSIDAANDSTNELLLEVEPDQAWLAPSHRGKRWGEMAAIAIAMTAKKQADVLTATARWPEDFIVPLKINVGADIFSTSGETFLRMCADYLSHHFDLATDQRLKLVELEFEPRW